MDCRSSSCLSSTAPVWPTSSSAVLGPLRPPPHLLPTPRMITQDWLTLSQARISASLALLSCKDSPALVITLRTLLTVTNRGQNLIMNMADHGFTICAFNRTVSKVDRFLENEAKGMSIVGAHSVEEFVSKLKSPRRVMLLVHAGQAVDDWIEKLLPLLS